MKKQRKFSLEKALRVCAVLLIVVTAVVIAIAGFGNTQSSSPKATAVNQSGQVTGSKPAILAIPKDLFDIPVRQCADVSKDAPNNPSDFEKIANSSEVVFLGGNYNYRILLLADTGEQICVNPSRP